MNKPTYGREVVLTLKSREQVVAIATPTSLYSDIDWVFEDTNCVDHKPADVESWKYKEDE